MPTFYRVLDPMTIERWKHGQFNGSHMHSPLEWHDTWNENKSTNPDDYLLKCKWGTHTKDARAAFIANAVARNGLGGDEWPKPIRIRVGELDGPCAWETPEQAWKYALNGDPEMTWIVVFEGEKIGEIPEKQGGGIQVSVTNAGHIYSLEQFIAEFGEKCGFEKPKKQVDL